MDDQAASASTRVVGGRAGRKAGGGRAGGRVGREGAGGQSTTYQSTLLGYTTYLCGGICGSGFYRGLHHFFRLLLWGAAGRKALRLGVHAGAARIRENVSVRWCY